MSLLPAVYLPEARDDIDAAYLAYEQNRLGLALQLDCGRSWTRRFRPSLSCTDWRSP